jgi:hypoxanthine phosphoribosyltransferase
MIPTQDVSWADIESLVEKLSENILKLSRNFSSITTLSRGGLVPSRLLADALGLKKIFVDQKIVNSDSLFVDDIFDTGKTFSNVFSNADDPSKFLFATLFARRGMKYPEQLLYAEKTLDDSYVVFPWDKFEFENSLK